MYKKYKAAEHHAATTGHKTPHLRGATNLQVPYPPSQAAVCIVGCGSSGRGAIVQRASMTVHGAQDATV